MHRYSETPLTETEFKTLSSHEQERVKRMALARESGALEGGTMSTMWGSTSNVTAGRCRRIGQSSHSILPSGVCRGDQPRGLPRPPVSPLGRDFKASRRVPGSLVHSAPPFFPRLRNIRPLRLAQDHLT